MPVKPRHPASGIFRSLPVLCLLSVLPLPLQAFERQTATAEQIMQEVTAQQFYEPYVYEEQLMVLQDRRGHRDVRSLRLFARLKPESRKLLLVFDDPREIQGVALRLLVRHDHAQAHKTFQLFMPSLEQPLFGTSDEGRASHFLGTDFAIRDLLPEDIALFDYRRLEDQVIDEVAHFVIEALPAASSKRLPAGYDRRQLLIRQDNFLIVRTDYFDRYQRHIKTRSLHELENYGIDNWQAGMVLMENHRDEHRSLLRINQRVFSPDYVPEQLFDEAWLLQHRHFAPTSQILYEISRQPLIQDTTVQ